MTKPISEQALEDTITPELIAAHYLQRSYVGYDKALCLDAWPLIDFVVATQPEVR